MNTEKQFLGKCCKIQFKNGFVLIGTVIDINNEGFFFQTPQKTSFISYEKIFELIPIGGVNHKRDGG
jgi:hypothetical protein